MKRFAATVMLAGLSVFAGLSIPGAPVGTSASAAPPEGRAQAQPNQPSSDAVIEWNRILNGLQATPGVQPATIQPTYELALVHLAIYDAVVSIDHSAAPYLFRVKGPRDASIGAAADAAAHDTLVHLYPAEASLIDQDYLQTLSQVPVGDHQRDGVAVGRAVASQLLALRTNDGSQAPLLPYTPGAQPGDFQPVPPKHTNPPQFDQWSSVKPFALRSANQFRPGAPPALTSTTYANAINETKRLGIQTGSTRTPDQSQLAVFWNPAPWATFNQVAQTAAIARHASLSANARTFALLNLTLADSAIAFYDAKYTYNLWRPVTAIESVNTGNAAVISDPTWTPLVATANDPSYPGAHSAFGAASAAVLSSVFGLHFDFTVSSSALPGVNRSFTSFAAAGEEAGLSRIFAGVHTRIDHVAGRDLGADVADFILDHFLTR